MRFAVVALLLLSVSACATLRGGDGPLTLTYDTPVSASYAFHDSTGFSIGAGPMGAMDVSTVQEGTAALALSPEDDALAGTLSFPRLTATFRNPGQGDLTATAGDVDGSFQVRVSPRGVVEVTDTPSLSRRLTTVTDVASLVNPLFLRLPEGAVEPGATWTDTLTSVEHAGELRTETWRVMTSTLVGDTVVGDRDLLRINLSTVHQIEVTGSSGGVEIVQRVSGETGGEVLWDPALGLLHSREEAGGLSGTIDIPGRAQGLPVEGYVQRRIRLEDALSPDP